MREKGSGTQQIQGESDTVTKLKDHIITAPVSDAERY